LKYLPAFRTRFAKGSQDVKAQIPDPDNIIACARTRGIWPETSWAQDPIKGGGQILSQGCHVVDLMFYLAGAEPESVYATGGMFHHTKPEPLDTINASVKYTNGAVGAFLGGDGGTGGLMMHHSLPNGCTFFVMAAKQGRTGIALDHGENACFESCDPEWKPPYVSCAYGGPQAAATSNGLADIMPTLAKAILTDGELPATVHDGARATRFILKCFQSAKSGKIVTF
jgi:myo-inositol 2-dehydrogenase / D-chiro-inositol 1-dehydrogenase